MNTNRTNSNWRENELAHTMYTTQMVEEVEIEEVARPAPKPTPHPSTQLFNHQQQQQRQQQQQSPMRMKNVQGSGHPTVKFESGRAVAIREKPELHLVGVTQEGENMRKESALKNPQLNSTTRMQKQLVHLAEQRFEEDEALHMEMERRLALEVPRVAQKVLDYTPSDRRFENLIPIDSGQRSPIAVPRKVKKTTTTRNNETINKYDAYERDLPLFSTDTDYTLPSKTPPEFDPDNIYQQLYYIEQELISEGFEYET